jgi:HlyD family secretion protein
MRRRTVSRIHILTAVALAMAVVSCRREAATRSVIAARGPLAVWSVYDGRLDARNVELITSGFSGSAIVDEVASEGSHVQKGDPLVRFDSSNVERDIVKLERDAALAKAEVESSRNARMPMEIREIELQLIDARANHDAEKQYLNDSIELMKDALVSEQEIEQQRLRVSQAQSRMKQIEMQQLLTTKYLHPLKLERAQATLDAADQELALARAQLTNCTVTAPSGGMVVYRPLHLGTEYRTVRVGDTIFKNQPFLAIPDMDDIIVDCHVPEAELSRVNKGAKALITSLAYPDMVLEAQIESIGTMAQTLPGRSSWQKYFRVVIDVDGVDERLRSGMSVQIRILSYENDDALLLPRSAIWWRDGRPHCRVAAPGGGKARPIKVGRASATHYEVVEGLTAGTRVLLP